MQDSWAWWRAGLGLEEEERGWKKVEEKKWWGWKCRERENVCSLWCVEWADQPRMRRSAELANLLSELFRWLLLVCFRVRSLWWWARLEFGSFNSLRRGSNNFVTKGIHKGTLGSRISKKSIQFGADLQLTNKKKTNWELSVCLSALNYFCLFSIFRSGLVWCRRSGSGGCTA